MIQDVASVTPCLIGRARSHWTRDSKPSLPGVLRPARVSVHTAH